MVDVLLRRGAKVNQVNVDGISPLYIAILKGHVSLVEILMKAGADVNYADGDSATPLYIGSRGQPSYGGATAEPRGQYKPCR